MMTHQEDSLKMKIIGTEPQNMRDNERDDIFRWDSQQLKEALFTFATKIKCLFDGCNSEVAYICQGGIIAL